MADPVFVFVDNQTELNEDDENQAAERIVNSDMSFEEKLKVAGEFGVRSETLLRKAGQKGREAFVKSITQTFNPADLFRPEEDFLRNIRSPEAKAAEEEALGVMSDKGIQSKRYLISENVKEFYKKVPDKVFIEMVANRDPVGFKNAWENLKDLRPIDAAVEGVKAVGRSFPKVGRNALVELAKAGDTALQVEKKILSSNRYILDDFIDSYINRWVESPTAEGMNLLQGFLEEVAGTVVEGVQAPFTTIGGIIEGLTTEAAEQFTKTERPGAVDSGIATLIRSLATTPGQMVAKIRTGEVLEKPVTAALDAWITGDVINLARKIGGIGITALTGYASRKVARNEIGRKVAAEKEIIANHLKQSAAKQLPLDTSGQLTLAVAKDLLGQNVVFTDKITGETIEGIIKVVSPSGKAVSITPAFGEGIIRRNIKDIAISPQSIEGLGLKVGTAKEAPVGKFSNNPVTVIPQPKGPALSEIPGQARVGQSVTFKEGTKTRTGQIDGVTPKTITIRTPDGKKIRRNPKNVNLVGEPDALLSLTGKTRLATGKPVKSKTDLTFLDRPKYYIPKKGVGAAAKTDAPVAIQSISDLMKKFKDTRPVTENPAILTDSGEVVFTNFRKYDGLEDWLKKNVIPEDQIVGVGFFDPKTKTFYSSRSLDILKQRLSKPPSPNVTGKLSAKSPSQYTRTVNTMRRYADTAARNTAKARALVNEAASSSQLSRLKGAYESIGWTENRFKRWAVEKFGITDFENMSKIDVGRLRKGIAKLRYDRRGGPPQMGPIDQTKPKSVIPQFLDMVPTPKAYYESITEFLAPFQAPDLVLKRTAGDIGERFYHLINEAELDFMKDRIDIFKLLNKVAEGYSTKDRRTLFHLMNGTIKEAGLEGAVTNQMVGDVGTIFKPLMNSLADRLGIPANKRRKNYVSHIFEKVADQYAETGVPFLAKRTHLKYLKPRIGKKGFKEDAFEAMAAYIPAALRKIHFSDDVIKEANRLIGLMPTPTAKYAKRLIDYSRGKTVSPTNKALLRTARTIKDSLKERFRFELPLDDDFMVGLLQAIRGGSYRGGLSFNPGSAFKNLTQNVNTAAMAGPKAWGDAVAKYWTREGQQIIKDSGVMLESLPNEFRSLRGIGGRIRGLLNSWDDRGFQMFESVERLNRGVAAIAGYDAAIAAGKTPKEAMRVARELSRRTQFSFMRSDTPELFRDVGAKALLTFQRFPVSQTEFLANLGRLAADGNYRPIVNYIAATSTLAIAGMGANVDFTQTFGLNNPADVIPFIDAKKAISAGPLFNVIRDFIMAQDAAEGGHARKAFQLREDAYKGLAILTGVTGLPSLEIKRIYDFLDRWEQDWRVLDESGRLRQETDIWTELPRLIGITTWNERVRRNQMTRNYAETFEEQLPKRQALRELSYSIQDGQSGEWDAILEGYKNQTGEEITVGDIRRQMGTLDQTDFMLSIRGMDTETKIEKLLDKGDSPQGLDLPEEELLLELKDSLFPGRGARAGRGIKNSDPLTPALIRILKNRDWQLQRRRQKR